MKPKSELFTVLGIETSCDETAAALVRSDGTILAERLWSQTAEHAPYGGVVPEIAARAHMQRLDGLIRDAMDEAGLSFAELDAVAVTSGPGLIGGLIVGVMAAKAIASVHRLPFIAVNHLEGHALSVRLAQDTPFPFLLLLVSGGHCQLLAVEGVGRYRLLGETMDDALGEAFDKTAKLMGLPYPGGPALEKLALSAQNPTRFPLPRPMAGRSGCDFSFSGLKTAIRQHVETRGFGENPHDHADLAASFQHAAADVVCDRLRNAMDMFAQMLVPSHKGKGITIVVAGGVAANRFLRTAIEECAASHGASACFPPLPLCTDNAAMIAWAGIEHLRLGGISPLDTEPRARWPLMEM